jgi:hypothetical protein
MLYRTVSALHETFSRQNSVQGASDKAQVACAESPQNYFVEAAGTSKISIQTPPTLRKSTRLHASKRSLSSCREPAIPQGREQYMKKTSMIGDSHRAKAGHLSRSSTVHAAVVRSGTLLPTDNSFSPSPRDSDHSAQSLDSSSSTADSLSESIEYDDDDDDHESVELSFIDEELIHCEPVNIRHFNEQGFNHNLMSTKSRSSILKLKGTVDTSSSGIVAASQVSKSASGTPSCQTLHDETEHQQQPKVTFSELDDVIEVQAIDLDHTHLLNYDCLVMIFGYLSIADLCACRLSCKRWNHAGSDASLWRTVDFGRSRISKWSHAINALRSVESTRLILTMITNDFADLCPADNTDHLDSRSRNLNLLGLVGMIRIPQVTHIDLPCVEVSVLEKLASYTTPNITTLSACVCVVDRDTKTVTHEAAFVDIRHLAGLARAQSISLQCASGIRLPAISFVYDTKTLILMCACT